tara:strand:+ start:631 stop:981 length:351 start_codon:yes stop_codon:yes gene_type:complete
LEGVKGAGFRQLSTSVQSVDLRVREVRTMGHVVVKYKVTLDQPEDEQPDYDSIAEEISGFDEVQEVEVKPLAFGMMYIEVQAVLGEGEGIVDGFEDRVRSSNKLVGQIEALEMGRL